MSHALTLWPRHSLTFSKSLKTLKTKSGLNRGMVSGEGVLYSSGVSVSLSSIEILIHCFRHEGGEERSQPAVTMEATFPGRCQSVSQSSGGTPAVVDTCFCRLS